MGQEALSIAEIERRLAALGKHRSKIDAAEELGISDGAMHNTIRAARRHGIEVPPCISPIPSILPPVGHKGVIDYEIKDGVAVFGTDAHFWPDIITPGYRAFLWTLRKFHADGDLRLCGLLGDLLDAARLSRHPSIGWEKTPKPVDEIATVQARSREVRDAGGPKIQYPWSLGNHDGRYETKIANLIPQLEGIHGVHLKDHFPDHKPCWLFRINQRVVCKHRFKGGIHAAHNNTLWSGMTMVTGHLHSGKITPFSDYNGTRWGIDAGTLAAPYGPQFADYTELNPVNWVAVVPVLSFYNGRLLWPELVHVIDDHHWSFRGQVYEG